MEDTFDAVPISVARYLKSEPEPLQRSFEIVRSIDEKRRLLNLLFVAEFTKKQHGELRCEYLKQPYVKEFVRVGIDCSVQPVALTVDANHGFVHRNLIRISIAIGL